MKKEMNEPTHTVLLNETAAGFQKKKKNRLRRPLKWLLFSLVWSYLLFKFLFSDIEILLAKYIGIQNISIYLSLRLITISLLILVLWKSIGNKRFFKIIGAFLLFPIYPGLWTLIEFLYWKLPVFLWKKKYSFLLYSYIELIINFFAEFKTIMLKLFALITSFYLLFNTDSQWLVISIILFFVFQMLHLFKRYQQAFRPLKIFRLDFNNIEKLDTFSIEKIDKQFRIQNSNQKITQEQIKINQLEHLFMMSQLSEKLGIKIKSILTNSAYLESLIWKLLYSLFVSMVVFGGINYSLYKLNPSNFEVANIVDYFDFFYYSFFTIFPDGTDITPLSEISKFIRMSGVITGVVLNLLIFGFYFATITQKYKDNLNSIIKYFERSSNDVKEYIGQNYENSPSELLDKLKNQSTNLKKFGKSLNTIFGKSEK